MELELLLNSGAEELELVIPESIAHQLGMERIKQLELIFGGSRLKVDAGILQVTVLDPEAKGRTASLEAAVIQDSILDIPLLGILAQEKLRVIPDTVAGKPIFKE